MATVKQKTEMQPDNLALKNWYDNLPLHQAKGIIKIIAQNCGVSIHTVYEWMKGTPIRQAYKAVINQTANQQVFNL